MADAYKFTEPDYSNPSFQNKVVTPSKYVLMESAYYGTQGFSNGEYLFPFSREAFFEQRKTMVFYRNFIKSIINSLVDPVYVDPIPRTVNNAYYKAFINNCNGTDNLDEFCKDVAIYTRLFGNVFIVMDNFLPSELPKLEQEAIKERKFPFVYIQKPYQVVSYKLNRLNQLESITFKSEVIWEGKNRTQHITWDTNDSTIDILDGEKVISTTVIPHNLGVCPVIQVNSVNKSLVLPTPEFQDLVKINLAIFNKDSEIRDLERAQAFSIFYVQSDNKNLAVGPHACLNLPQGDQITIPPGFASPDSECLTVLMNSNKDLIETLFKLAEADNVYGIKEASSGIALSYKFKSKTVQLRKTSTVMESCEYRLMDLFGLYIKTKIEGTVTYPKDFEDKINETA